ETADDDQEDEQVVHRQRLLGDIAREVLGAHLHAAEDQHADPEQHRDPHIDPRPDRRLAQGGGVRLAHVEDIVEQQQPGDQDQGRDPYRGRYLHLPSGSWTTKPSGRRAASRSGSARAAATGPAATTADCPEPTRSGPRRGRTRPQPPGDQPDRRPDAARASRINRTSNGTPSRPMPTAPYQAEAGRSRNTACASVDPSQVHANIATGTASPPRRRGAVRSQPVSSTAITIPTSSQPR